MDEASRTIFQEAMIAVLLGGGCVSIVAHTQGYEAVLAFLGTLNPGNDIFSYFLLLLVFSAGFWALERAIVKLSGRVPPFIGQTRIITHQLGNSLHSVYRVIAGASIVASVSIIWVQPNASNLAIVSVALLFAAGALTVCIVLSKCSKYLEPVSTTNPNQ